MLLCVGFRGGRLRVIQELGVLFEVPWRHNLGGSIDGVGGVLWKYWSGFMDLVQVLFDLS